MNSFMICRGRILAGLFAKEPISVGLSEIYDINIILLSTDLY